MNDREHVLRRRVRREERKHRDQVRTRALLLVIAWLVVMVAVLAIDRAYLAVVDRAGEIGTYPAGTAGSGPSSVSPLGRHLPPGESFGGVGPEPTPMPTPEPAPEAYYPLTDGEREWVEWTVAAESANQSLEGQMAVALYILNTAQTKGIRPDQVVQEKGQYADPAPGRVTDSVREAVALVFDRGVRVTEEPIRYFYAPRYSRGTWHENNLEYVLTIGGHRFFKEAGA